jgi:hypothetical protein
MDNKTNKSLVFIIFSALLFHTTNAFHESKQPDTEKYILNPLHAPLTKMPMDIVTTLPNEVLETISEEARDNDEQNNNNELKEIITEPIQEADKVGTLETVAQNIKALKNNNKKTQKTLKAIHAKIQAKSKKLQTMSIEMTVPHSLISPHHNRQISHDRIANIHNDNQCCCTKKALVISSTLVLLAGVTSAVIYFACT